MGRQQNTPLTKHDWFLVYGIGDDEPPFPGTTTGGQAPPTPLAQTRQDAVMRRSRKQVGGSMSVNLTQQYTNRRLICWGAGFPSDVNDMERQVIRKRQGGVPHLEIAVALGRSVQWVKETEIRVLERLRQHRAWLLATY